MSGIIVKCIIIHNFLSVSAVLLPYIYIYIYIYIILYIYIQTYIIYELICFYLYIQYSQSKLDCWQFCCISNCGLHGCDCLYRTGH